MFFNTKKKEADFDRLFWDKRLYVEKIARRYANSPDLVDDLIQQVFLKLFMNIDKVIKADNQNSYIYAIAVNEIMDYFRKHRDKSKEVSMHGDLEEILVADHKNQDEKIHGDQLMERFVGMLNAMAPKRRNVISMRIFDDLSFNEISSVLQISEESARNLFSIGMKEIRKQLVKGGNYA